MSQPLQKEFARLHVGEHVEDKDPICAICHEPEGGSRGKYFTAPCDVKHKFHLDCIFIWKKSCVGHFKCPLCKAKLADTPTPSAQSTQEETVFETQYPSFVECSNCQEVSPYDYNCDACEKPICGDCLIKKPIVGGRLDFCPTCVKFFGSLRKVKDTQICAAGDFSTFSACSLCGSTLCRHCDVVNEDDRYCVSCVQKIGDLYLSKNDEVKDALARKVR